MQRALAPELPQRDQREAGEDERDVVEHVVGGEDPSAHLIGCCAADQRVDQRLEDLERERSDAETEDEHWQIGPVAAE